MSNAYSLKTKRRHRLQPISSFSSCYMAKDLGDPSASWRSNGKVNSRLWDRVGPPTISPRQETYSGLYFNKQEKTSKLHRKNRSNSMTRRQRIGNFILAMKSWSYYLPVLTNWRLSGKAWFVFYGKSDTSTMKFHYQTPGRKPRFSTSICFANSKGCRWTLLGVSLK